jgi:hypothetical protein
MRVEVVLWWSRINTTLRKRKSPWSLTPTFLQAHPRISMSSPPSPFTLQRRKLVQDALTAFLRTKHPEVTGLSSPSTKSVVYGTSPRCQDRHSYSITEGLQRRTAERIGEVYSFVSTR